MRLQQILENLVTSVPGATGAILADWEGEAVVSYAPEQSDYNIKFVGAHHGILLNRARELSERLCLGAARQITFLQENFHVITAPVNSDYYLVMTLRPGAAPAMARVPVKKAIREIEADIS